MLQWTREYKSLSESQIAILLCKHRSGLMAHIVVLFLTFWGFTVLLWHVVLYVENPKDSTKLPIELINKFSQGAKYKISTQKSAAFLYTSNEQFTEEFSTYSSVKNNKMRSKFTQGRQSTMNCKTLPLLKVLAIFCQIFHWTINLKW